jgi:cyanophycinase
MSIFLAGAGPDHVVFPEVFDRFAEAASLRSRQEASRVAVVVHNSHGNPESLLPAYVDPLLARIQVEVVPVLLGAGVPCDPSVFDGVDGLVVGGGLTPGYWDGLAASAGAISAAVAGGVPYLGFSAGAMIAPQSALLGGYLSRGIEVCGEECSEGLAELEIRDGLGLAPFAVDVHAAQAGTLSRAVGAVAAGLVERAVAVDENTALVLASAGDENFEVLGRGNCWDIRRSGTACIVSVLHADERPRRSGAQATP